MQTVPVRTLQILEYARENDARFVVTTSPIGRRSCRLVSGEADLPEPVPDVPHGVLESLRANRCLDLLEGATPGQARPTETFRLGDAGLKVLERDRKVLERRKALDAAAPETYVALRRRGRTGVGALCRVSRRTDRRVYFDRIDEGGVEGALSASHKAGRERYAALDDVAADPAERDAWRRAVEATNAMDVAIRAAEAELVAAVEPLTRRRDEAVESAKAAYAASTHARP